MNQVIFRFFLILYLLLSNILSHTLHARDFGSILQDFNKAGIPNKSIGISITQLPTKVYPFQTQNYGINQNLSFNPASVMKLITTRAALDLLGKSHKFETILSTNGKINNGVLDGDVFFIGGGDPKLVIEDIEQIVIQLKNLGLNKINGDWIVDDSLFGETEIDPSNFDGQPSKPYNVGPNAAMVNFKSSEVTINALKRGFQINLRPELSGIRIKNNLKFVDGKCFKNIVSTSLNKKTLRIFGKIGKSCKKYSFYVSLLNHHQFGFSVFKKAWSNVGGKISGSAHKGKTPLSSKLLLKWKSPRSLIRLIKDINTMSNNPMARTLFLNLSASSNNQASIARSREVINKWLKKKDFNFPEMVIHNGSGLSRKARISAGNLTSLLVDATGDVNAFDWIRTLPRVGLEGTVSKRFRNKPITGNAWLKTGSLKGVQAYGGYVRTEKKNWFAVSILINDRFANKAKQSMDNLIEWIYQNK